MKAKALEIMRYHIEGYYDVKYDKNESRHNKRCAECEMLAVKEALIDLGLITKDEYMDIRHEVHDRVKSEVQR